MTVVGKIDLQLEGEPLTREDLQGDAGTDAPDLAAGASGTVGWLRRIAELLETGGTGVIDGGTPSSPGDGVIDGGTP